LSILPRTSRMDTPGRWRYKRPSISTGLASKDDLDAVYSVVTLMV